jgi:hypothetical protein
MISICDFSGATAEDMNMCLFTGDAAARCRCGGASKNDTDFRERWEMGRIQDRYAAIQLDSSDANCVFLLE